ncbi:MAG TPA: diguanylate cyclase [Gemmatimonadales bacterium]|nr:diguanylate cyclase [Gemmatimonadales bacterium]
MTRFRGTESLPHPSVLTGLAALFALPVLFGAAGLGLGGDHLLSWLATWGSLSAFAIAATLSFLRAAAVIGERAVWLWAGVACSSWALANLYYALFFAPNPMPLPSLADIGYFTFPIALGAGVAQYARTQLARVPVDVWLDGFVAALSTTAVAAALLFGVEDVSTADAGGVLTTLVYPLMDVALLGLIVGIWSLMSWRADRRMRLFLGAALMITAGDAIVFSRVLGGQPIGGALCNIGWTLGVALLVSAAWLAGRREGPIVPSPRRRLVLPVLFAVVSLVVLSTSSLLDVTAGASIFALAALTVSCVRLYRSFHEAHALADSHRLAITDELTNLPNRRRLITDLHRASAGPERSILALFDLDGFKRFNDTFGHSEGDALLSRIAGRLSRAVEPRARAYRLGGDEFCVLSRGSGDPEALLAAASDALADQGVGWEISASFGVVEMPSEAGTVSEALRIADRRMYAQKDRRPAAARTQAVDVLLSALGEQQPALGEHCHDVTGPAGAVATRLGMSAEEVDDVVRAAELHDVGKLAIPREILDKPGPLDRVEWELMREHTIIGERMLMAAPALRPIATLVRSSHERWDGGGYPDGLTGEEIPLGARIIAVCDSYDAMVADRSYRKGMPAAEARAELRRRAGTQFDPYVVDAFLAESEPAGDARILEAVPRT